MPAAHADDSGQQTPLAQLVGGSAGPGRWRLQVVGVPQERTYTYTSYGKAMEGATFSVCFVSSDLTQYCKRKFTRQGKEPIATNRFKPGQGKVQGRDGVAANGGGVRCQRE